MKLTFYTFFGVGDAFESREFVRDFIKLAGEDHARYAHRPLPGFFADLPEITSVEVTEQMEMRRALDWRKDGARFQANGADELWVNTWIGARNGDTSPPGDYVIHPGVGCTVENLYRMWGDYLREAGLKPLPRPVVEYIPQLDYSKIDTGDCEPWIERHLEDKLVLICNGKTGSGHASNFDMGAMACELPVVPHTLFLFTERFNGARNDFVFTDDLTCRDRQPFGAYGHCDFNAISYLSQYCDVIVGRCSGAQMGCQTLDNWNDPSKILLCFTNHISGSCFVRDPEALGLKMKRVWSGADNPQDAAKVLKEVLK